jgi:hypothetical protein
MTNQQDLSQLTTRQLIDLLWDIKGTPGAQAAYAELGRRPAKLTLKPDDPEWETKFTEHLLSKQNAQPQAQSEI